MTSLSWIFDSRAKSKNKGNAKATATATTKAKCGGLSTSAASAPPSVEMTRLGGA